MFGRKSIVTIKAFFGWSHPGPNPYTRRPAWPSRHPEMAAVLERTKGLGGATEGGEEVRCEDPREVDWRD